MRWEKKIGIMKNINLPGLEIIEMEPSELAQANIRPNSCGAKQTELTEIDLIPMLIFPSEDKLPW